MFQSWETFYLMVGTCAAALVGMMFIVITLTADIRAEEINRGVTIYHNPTVFHLGVVVFVSALLLIPEHLLSMVAAGIALSAIVGLVYVAITIRRLYQRYEFYQATVWDKLFFGFVPAVTYALMAVGAALIFALPEFAAESIGATTLLLLLIAIRNAWDVATFAVRLSRQLASGEKSE
jgi:hypothetical protein